METHDVPGLSFSIAKEGRIIREEALGFADLETKEALKTDHRFRIASVSKPITSTAIFLLIEGGKLALDDLVLGEKGILKTPGQSAITLRHLLNHTSGGWTNDKLDPMFQMIDLGHAELIQETLKNVPPTHPPGVNYAYSNFGYCLLGRVIEKVSGQSYEDFIREKILTPCGVAGMTIGKGEREVSYYTEGKRDTFEMNVARMDSHGGWIGTPREMLGFALGVDGFPDPKDILKPESLAAMITPGTVHDGYACGWNVNPHGNYWHSGSLPGLTSLLVRTRSGYCWAACLNTRKEGLGGKLDELMWTLARAS